VEGERKVKEKDRKKGKGRGGNKEGRERNEKEGKKTLWICPPPSKFPSYATGEPLRLRYARLHLVSSQPNCYNGMFMFMRAWKKETPSHGTEHISIKFLLPSALARLCR